MKKKTVSLLLALLLCLSCALPASAAGGSRFSDVPDNAWYAKAVNALADGGILKGRANGKFDPAAPVTLAELSVVLMRLRGWGDDIANDGHWAGNAMYMFGLGTDWSEAEQEVLYTYAAAPAYRADAVSVLGIFALYDFHAEYQKAHPDDMGVGAIMAAQEIMDKYDLNGIADRDAYYALASAWSDIWGHCYEANGHFFVAENIDQAYQFGVISGIDENHTCNAAGTLTRAELAQMCYNMGWTTAGCIEY